MHTGFGFAGAGCSPEKGRVLHAGGLELFSGQWAGILAGKRCFGSGDSLKCTLCYQSSAFGNNFSDTRIADFLRIIMINIADNV
uniref:Uncharacterized protein n=1 Tax=uncultured bacterium A1Q1_fos_2140 TaxID=1256565 RepID=L7W0B0_9BACT|nr:hypothetical protein [uncultured bacterium A1Q1_fos_2140]